MVWPLVLTAMTIATMLLHRLIYATPLLLDDGPMADIDDGYFAGGDRLLHCQ